MNQTKQNSIITYIGQNPGLSTAIFVGVHGNEPCGIRAIENFFKHNSIENGTVIVVFANPHAVEKNVRFTEFNLNRAFKNIDEYPDEIKSTYEVQRAQELKKILEDVDVLLDIHSSTSIESEPFVICEQNAMTYVNAFPESFSKVVSGFDNLQPGGTDWYMNSVGKVGICIECGFSGCTSG